MNLIAAVDRRWGIGYKGKLLVNIPQDKRLFQEETTGKVIVMGRKTLSTLPNGIPLVNRTNIILSGDTELTVRGATVVHSVEEALELLKQYSSEDIYIIGGEETYREFLPYCHIAHITYVDYEYQADAFFPNLDENPEWELCIETEEQTYFDISYCFRMYRRV